MPSSFPFHSHRRRKWISYINKVPQLESELAYLRGKIKIQKKEITHLKQMKRSI